MDSKRLRPPRRLAFIAPALAAALLAPSAASAQPVKVGNLFSQSNGVTNNQLIVFNRFSDGTFAEAQRVDTGGQGAFSPACPGAPCPITDSQGSVAVNAAGTLVFATNAGSDTISSFRVSSTHGVQLVDQVGSGGDLPISVDIHGNVLYVLNQLTGNIDGFRFTLTGQLTEIPGSNQSLATPGPGGAAAQVGFDKVGRVLVVTERATNLIDTFTVTNGVAGPVSSTLAPANATTPFGFAFDNLRHLVVSDALSEATGATTTYAEGLRASTLTPIDTESSGGGAPCWVVITPDNRYVYVSNTTTKSIGRYSLSASGHLTLLGTTPTVGTIVGAGQFPTDEALSRDGRFLYVITPDVFVGDFSTIDAFRVEPNGDLTFLSEAPETLPIGLSGLAAR